MPLIKENNKNTGYSYDIVTDCDGIKSKCGITVMISNISTKATLHYDLTDGKLVAGKDTATEDDRDFADYYTQLYLREWQAKAGLRYLVRFTTESDCYYDFSEEKLYNATGKKSGKSIGGKPVKFTPTEQGIFSRLVNMAGYLCDYLDISLAQTGSEKGMSAATIQVHVNHIRDYDDIALRPFIEEGNKGYTYTGKRAEWILDKPEKSREPKRSSFSIKEFGASLFSAGKIDRIPWTTYDQKFLVQNVSESSVDAICRFFFPNVCVWCGEKLLSNFKDLDKASLILYIGRVCRVPDTEWQCCRNHLNTQLGQTVKLRLYPMIDPSNPVPKTQDDLLRVAIQLDDFVGGILEQMQDYISSIINEYPYINEKFFLGKTVTLTKENLPDAIVALSWIAFYQDLILNFPLLSEELEKYRKVLVSTIKSIFFPPSPSELDSIVSLYNAAKEAMSQALLGLDDRTERIAEFEKVFVEQLNLSEILRNSGIRLAGASNSNENESPIKVR